MKTLYLLRHAKSSWDDPDLSDFERPLNKRGKSAAPFMGEWMSENGFQPDIVLASPATRARETARLAKDAADISAEIRHIEQIYEASPQTLLQVASTVDNEFDSAMMVGHNPGMEGFTRLLTGKSESMPTASLAVIELDIKTWSDIAVGCGKLRRIARPKEEMKKLGKGK